MFRYFRVVLMSRFCAAIFAAPLCAQPQEAPKTEPIKNSQLFNQTLAVLTQTPSDSVDNFVQIYNYSKQLNDLALFVVGAETINPEYKQLQPQYEKIRLPFRIVIREYKEVINDDHAQVEVVLATGDYNWNLKISWKETLALQREKTKWGATWRIMPGKPEIIRGAAENYIQRLTTFVAYPQQMRILLSRQKSAEHIKVLELQILLYLRQHEHVFNFKSGTFLQDILPYGGGDEEWETPENAAAKAAQTFSFNDQLLGKNYNEIKDKAKTVMVYLGQNEKLDFRFDGFAVVGFADGRVEFINAEQAKTLRWTP